MPDGLDISGGTTWVATEDLEFAAEQLGRLSAEAGAMGAALARLDSPVTPGSFYSGQAQVDLELASRMLTEVAFQAQVVAGVLTVTGQAYGIAEHVVTGATRALLSVSAQARGAVLPFLGLVAAPALITLWVSLKASGGLDGPVAKFFEKDGIPKGSSFFRANNQLVNNAVTVSVVRSFAQGLGPLTLGAMGMPIGIPQTLGRFPYAVSAQGLVSAGRSLGLFDETPVRLAETESRPVTAAPEDYRDRLARVPHEASGEPGAQVMIEKYSVPGEPDRFSVYIGGTVTFSPATTSEPWDMTSNMVNATGAESGSAASVRAAMEAAGIDKDSPVQFTGFSQGGGTAAQIVASEDYNTQGLVTFGGPTGQVALPHGIPTVLVEHADDPVPALGGEQENTDAVLVRRDVFGGQNLDKTWVVPSHHIEYYLKTASIMDESRSPQLDATLKKLDAFTAGATLESSTAYRYERVNK